MTTLTTLMTMTTKETSEGGRAQTVATGQQSLQSCHRAHHQLLHILFVSLHAHFNPQEMVPILWAFAKVRRGDDVLFGMVARVLMRQTNAGVVGVVGGGEFWGAWTRTQWRVVRRSPL
jgi:hypothetical protein